ncbi:MAG: type II secretion system F family protein [Candidatus Thermoplasmatota archaeon]|jgi:flagellar protein FlaJ|nr:type II secretion system F family protein [Candidatus Thermoplasmatota archaeon]MEC7977145.1 type II secretion system F family protein [Candidatus Thermoplasmatota archaeon]MEC8073360.1 type II secretion system F family protein [Candidatus Thermoplasmatota archaeon]MEC8076798.1 type II secretion system F family protein [Candidatus Thermoplasmatota archaeon]MEC8671335.1 type II secretion system F family protein [Candidatus Thermoplasmatota archaeon]|tara:strand:- start:995 stop:2236 length:1242 start_codon:yes stop_codon:yes gene_type:complete
MSIKGNLEKKIYRDQRTGVKRRWMEYSRVNRWLSVRDKVTDWAPAFVAFFSIIFALFFFMIANINNTTDGQTLVVDSDGDKQFDNPWDMNDGQFSFTFGNTYNEAGGQQNRAEAIYGLGLPLAIQKNESVDSDPLVDGIENEMIPNAWYRAFPEISAIDYIVFGLISLLLPYGIYGYRRDQIRARVEEKFPDFLRDLAEYWKGGLSMTVAIQTLAKGEYGNLNDEVNKMSSQISWGVSFGEVLEMFTERVTSPIVTRAVRMVDEANRAGGKISDILLAASYDAREIKALETERRQEVGSYVTVIYASFFVYLGIILVLASTFIPAIVDSSAATGGSGSMSIGNLTIREMNEVWISTVFLYSLIIQGMGMGLAAGFMSTGRLYSAFLRASFLLFLGWFIFELAGITTSMITPQI